MAHSPKKAGGGHKGRDGTWTGIEGIIQQKKKKRKEWVKIGGVVWIWKCNIFF